MSKFYITNAFSLGMLGEEKRYIIHVAEISNEYALELVRKYSFISAIGHDATAKIISQILGVNIPVNRIAVKLQSGDIALVFQLLQRLPEGKVLSE
jgi:hypothetical protein